MGFNQSDKSIQYYFVNNDLILKPLLLEKYWKIWFYGRYFSRKITFSLS